MAKPRVLILRAAGTNCDAETVAAFEAAGASADRVHVNRILEKPGILDEYRILTIPGGFTYGDDIAAGVVLANELTQRLGDGLYRFRDRGGLILGICNGFQVLVKTGLLPGNDGGRRVATLSGNDSGKFEDRWIYLEVAGDHCVFTKGMGGPVYIPVAHGEGKFVASGSAVRALEKGDQVVFRYALPDGKPANGVYPFNPNGSVADIAGIDDTTGRVLGLMPHPERHYTGVQHPQWTRRGLMDEGDGLPIFRNAARYAAHL